MKYFLGILLWINYRKLKDALKVWSGNNFGNKFNNMNPGWNNILVNHRLAGSRSLPSGDYFKIITELGHPTPIPLDNVGLLLFKIC